MVDIHAHILPGLDDAPPTFEASLSMLRLATQAGTEAIAATPHFSRARGFDPAAAHRQWEQLQYLAGHSIRIYRGCEVELSPETVDGVLAQPSRYTINGFQYLLTEFREAALPEECEEWLAELQGAGLAVILAHPELHIELTRKHRRLERWVKRGVFLQIDAGSLTGRFGPFAKRSADRLVQRGLVHFIASNGHDLQNRPPRLDEARLHLKLDYPDDYAHLLLDRNPQAVVNGERLPSGPIEAPFLGRRWF